MIIGIDITKVTIITGRGADKVFLHTTEDSPCPGLSKQPLGLDFSVAAGDGLRYVIKVLKIDDEYIEVIKI